MSATTSPETGMERPAGDRAPRGAATSKPHVAPIHDDDVDDVAEYLHRRMASRLPADRWRASLTPAWQVDPPNHGFHLRADGVVVGAYLATYCQRHVGAVGTVRVCNLAAWCVDPPHRSSGIRLLRTLLAQTGYEFVDLSPSGNVIPLNERLGFRHADTSTALYPCLPRPSRPGRATITTDARSITDALTGSNLRIYRDHEASPATRHLLVQVPHGACHVMYRRDRRRGLPVFASILHVSDREIFAAHAARIGRHLLVRHGVAALLCETRIVPRPRGSLMLRAARPKMFKSDKLGPDDIDNLYSELTELSW